MLRQERLRQFAAIVLLLLAAFFGYRLLDYWQENRTAERAFSDISRQFHEGQNKASAEPVQEGPIPAMEALMAENSDLYAWVTVEGTHIDYPVMFTPESPEYYLRKNFEKKQSTAGTPFLDGRHTPETDDNLIVYGHNMKSGSMFADLLRFRNEDYFKEHSKIRFTTLYQEKRYQVIAAFPSEVHRDRNTFPWFNYLSFENEAEFQDFIRQLEEESLFDLPERPVYGDQFLTLATCSYHDSTGRFVIIGREVPAENSKK